MYFKELNCQMAKNNWPVLRNRYVTLELLGMGGFGEVYKAYDLDTLTHVALKIGLPEKSGSPEACFKRMKYLQR
jgi:serine/threonine protein kinase